MLPRDVVYEERFKFLRDIKAKFRVYGLVYNFFFPSTFYIACRKLIEGCLEFGVAFVEIWNRNEI